MNPSDRPVGRAPSPPASLCRGLAQASTVMIFVCVAILTVDYIAARRQAPRDETAIAALQVQVSSDASIAPKLAAEHQRISERRRARKSRIDRLSLLLIAVMAMFLWSAKQLPAFQYPRPVTKDRLVTLKGHTPSSPGKSAASSPQPAPAIDLTFVDEIVGREGRSREAAIPILQAIQARFRYLPDEALRRVCELTEITPAQIAGTSSFYAQLRRKPAGKHLVRVCHGTACHVSGARQIAEELRRSLGIPEGGETDPDLMFTIDEVACLGCCSLAPVLMVDERTVGKLTPAIACEALDAVEPATWSRSPTGVPEPV
ncbi:MAG: NAD(P)H-dependent oxidoreductase subunit E [Bryobacteraceae bacterium]